MNLKLHLVTKQWMDWLQRRDSELEKVVAAARAYVAQQPSQATESWFEEMVFMAGGPVAKPKIQIADVLNGNIAKWRILRDEARKYPMLAPSVARLINDALYAHLHAVKTLAEADAKNAILTRRAAREAFDRWKTGSISGEGKTGSAR